MNSALKLLIYFAILFAVSCIHPNDMLTVINSDGSCYREFTANGNPQFLLGDTAAKLNPFPVEIDGNWKITWKFKNSKLHSDFPIKKSVYDSINNKIKQNKELQKHGSTGNTSTELLIYACHNYKSVPEMADQFKFKHSDAWSKMKVKYKLIKKFRWFYTYFTYQETYPKMKLNFEIPIEKYLTKNEALYWFTGKPNIMQGKNGVEVRDYIGNIEDNFNEWFSQNTWNNEYKVLIKNYDRIDRKPVSKKRLILMRDTIFNSFSGNKSDNKMEYSLNKYFKTDVFSELWKNENSPMKKYEKAFEDQNYVQYFTKSTTYKLILPGKVINSTDATIHGDTLSWKLTAYRMIPADYIIEAQSRKVNIWAFILTGIIILIAVGSFLWNPGKKVG
ncbi:MAG: hypothetical protein PHT07_03340 [Paludibacter sp.]|nr:hypothetical protein [Paludibacter sp.]